VKRRSYHQSKVGSTHLIEKSEGIDYVRQKFAAEIVVDEAE
jgi:hypothetical protein